MDVIEENYEIVDEDLPKMIRKKHGEPEYGKGLIGGLDHSIKYEGPGSNGYVLAGAAKSDRIPANRSAYLLDRYVDNKEKDDEQLSKSFGNNTHNTKYTPKKMKIDDDIATDYTYSDDSSETEKDSSGHRLVKSKGELENDHTKRKASKDSKNRQGYWSTPKTKEEIALSSARRHFVKKGKTASSNSKLFNQEEKTKKAIKDRFNK